MSSTVQFPQPVSYVRPPQSFTGSQFWRPIIWVGFMAAGFITTLAVLGWDPGSHRQLTAVAVGIVLVGLGCAGFTALPLRIPAALRRLKLGPWIGIGFVVVYGLTATNEVDPNMTAAVTDRSFYAPAALVASSGMIAASVAYRAFPANFLARATRGYGMLLGSLRGDISWSAVWVLLAVGVASNIALVSIGAYGYTGDIGAALTNTSSLPYVLNLGSDVLLLSVLLAGFQVGRRRTTLNLVQFAIVMALTLSWALVSGMKGQTLVVLAAAFFGYSVTRRISLLVLFGGAIVAFLVVAPFVNNFRDSVAIDTATRMGFQESVELVTPDAVWDSVSTSNPSDTAVQLLDRGTRLPQVAIFLQTTPTVIDYAPLSEVILSPVLGLIPRSLWPDKPVLATGLQVREYYGLSNKSLSSVATTPFGDLYRHGGVVVVVLGMAFYGLVMRLADTRPFDAVIDPRVLFVPLLLFPHAVKLENAYLGWGASLVGILAVSVLAARLTTLLSTPSRSGSRSRA